MLLLLQAKRYSHTVVAIVSAVSLAEGTRCRSSSVGCREEAVRTACHAEAGGLETLKLRIRMDERGFRLGTTYGCVPEIVFNANLNIGTIN